LEGVPEKHRSAKVWMLLGQVYKVIPGENGRAVNAFKAVLKENPDCLECIEALYDLEANLNDIVYSLKTESTDAWLYPIAQVKSYMVSFEYESK
jgi:hypothetical protein